MGRLYKVIVGLAVALLPTFSSGQVLTDIIPNKELPTELRKMAKKSNTYAIQTPVYDSIGQIGTYLIIINSTNSTVYIPTLTSSRKMLVANSDCVYEPEFWFDEMYFYTIPVPKNHFIVAMYNEDYNDCVEFQVQWFAAPSFQDLKEYYEERRENE